MTTKEIATVKNNETANELDAVEEFNIEDVDDVEMVEIAPGQPIVEDSNDYPATDVVDLNNEINQLSALVANGEATDVDEERLLGLMAQRKAQRTGKSITDVTKSITASATAIQKDELEGSWMGSMDTFIGSIGGPSTLAELVATFNNQGISYIGDSYGNDVIVEAGTVETATGKFQISWADSGKMTIANQRRYYANQLLLLDWIEREVIAKTGVPKGKLDGNVVRNEHGEITIGESTVTYEAKVAGGTNSVNRTGATVKAKLPDGATLWMSEPYTVEVAGYGTVTVPEFSNAKIRNLFDAKKVSTGTFNADNIKRNEGPFRELALAYKNLGYYDGKLGALPGAATSYDGTIQKALCQVGHLDNYLLEVD